MQKSGSWLSYGQTRIGQGREAARKFLKENRALDARLEHDIRVASGIVRVDAAPSTAEIQWHADDVDDLHVRALRSYLRFHETETPSADGETIVVHS